MVDGVSTKYKTQGRKMAKKVQWKTLIEDVVALEHNYNESDVTFIAIKHELKMGTANIYMNTIRRAQEGKQLKGNYNQLFLEELRKSGFSFDVKTYKPAPKEQPAMGLMDYKVTGDVDSLHEEIKVLKIERDLYKRKYDSMVRALHLLHKANPAIV